MMKTPISLLKYLVPSVTFWLIILFMSPTTLLQGKDKKISLAVLPVENMNKDSRQGYLSGIIGSLVRQDLSLSGMVFIVNRENMKDILSEQKLQFTGVMDEKSIIETGRMVGAEYILKGGFVFLGEELFINLDLINTETGRSYSFSERGYEENTVHALAEKLIYHLTGQDVSFQSEEGSRTIIAKGQLEPGRVMLFSPLVDARIYIDGAFNSYTIGESTQPVEIVLPPGRHTIRTHLTGDFGVIREPEILFSDWRTDFDLKSGETLVLEDKTKHFNSILYHLQQVVRDDLQLIPGSEEPRRAMHDTFFIDRQGKKYSVKLELTFVETKGEETAGVAQIHLEYNGEVYDLSYTCPAGDQKEFKLALDKSDLSVELDCVSQYRWSLEYSIWRNDIHQGLHWEEEHQSP